MKNSKETFESGELVEVSHEGVNWFKRYFVGISRTGQFVTESSHCVFIAWNHVRKIEKI
jgi:hypothetical protein